MSAPPGGTVPCPGLKWNDFLKNLWNVKIISKKTFTSENSESFDSFSVADNVWHKRRPVLLDPWQVVPLLLFGLHFTHSRRRKRGMRMTKRLWHLRYCESASDFVASEKVKLEHQLPPSPVLLDFLFYFSLFFLFSLTFMLFEQNDRFRRVVRHFSAPWRAVRRTGAQSLSMIASWL